MSFPDAEAFWNQRFSQPGFLFGTEPNVFLASQRALLKPGMKALSLADGEGRNSIWMAQQGMEVDAVELSGVALEKARGLARERGATVNFQRGDLLDWDMGREAYDLVAAVFIQFLSPAQRPGVFRRMVTALKPGGHLVLQGYTPRQIEFKTGGPPLVENLYTEDLLRDSFSDLEILHLRTHEAHVAEGTGHLGWSALIDMVGRKVPSHSG